MKYKILTIIIAAVLVNFCFVNGASAGWTEGKFGSAFEFDGVNDYVSVLDPLGNVKTVSFWIKADSTTEKIMELRNDDGAYIEVSGGTITATGFTSPTIFVDGVVGSTIDTDWHHIAITTDADINASAVKIGKVATDYFTGKLDAVRIYPYARSADEVRLDYNAGVATHLGPSGKTCAEDPASCMDYGLVGSWNMDEGTGTTAYDGSDEGNDGSLGGGDSAKMPKWTAGHSVSNGHQVSGGAGGLQFDGVNDYIDASLTPNFDEATITAWIKINEIPANINGIISNYNSGDGNHLGLRTYNDGRISFFVDDNVHAYWGEKNPTVLNEGEWYFVAGVFKKNDYLKIYVDETVYTQDSINTGTITSSVSFKIGNDESIGGSYHFKGSIDEVRIYDRALTAEEVRWHYNRGGPVASWDFDEGSGQTAYDGVGDADGQLGSDSDSDGDVNDPGWSAP